MSDNSNFNSAPGGQIHPSHFEQKQGEDSGYNQLSSQQSQGMGGGDGAHGSGVAGGWSGSSSNQQQTQSGEKQDWLDKGIQFAGQKAGVNVSQQNADKAGDFINKEFNQTEGRNLPGVQ